MVLKRHYEYWSRLHRPAQAGGAVLVPRDPYAHCRRSGLPVDLDHIKAAVCTPEGPVRDNLLEVRALPQS